MHDCRNKLLFASPICYKKWLFLFTAFKEIVQTSSISCQQRFCFSVWQISYNSDYFNYTNHPVSILKLENSKYYNNRKNMYFITFNYTIINFRYIKYLVNFSVDMFCLQSARWYCCAENNVRKTNSYSYTYTQKKVLGMRYCS